MAKFGGRLFLKLTALLIAAATVGSGALILSEAAESSIRDAQCAASVGKVFAETGGPIDQQISSFIDSCYSR